MPDKGVHAFDPTVPVQGPADTEDIVPMMQPPLHSKLHVDEYVNSSEPALPEVKPDGEYDHHRHDAGEIGNNCGDEPCSAPSIACSPPSSSCADPISFLCAFRMPFQHSDAQPDCSGIAAFDVRITAGKKYKATRKKTYHKFRPMLPKDP